MVAYSYLAPPWHRQGDYFSDAHCQVHPTWRLHFSITMVVTIGIGCVFISITKGPRYSADSYIINDKEKPSSTRDR